MSEDCDKAAESGVDEDISTLVWWPDDIKCYELTSDGPAQQLGEILFGEILAGLTHAVLKRIHHSSFFTHSKEKFAHPSVEITVGLACQVL